MRKYVLPVLALVFIGLYYSCTKDRAQLAQPLVCTGAFTKPYNQGIDTILHTYCYAGCHDAIFSTINDGVDFSTYASSRAAFESKDVICSIKHAGCIAMPKDKDKLSDSLITILECWQKDGFPEN